MEQMFFGNKLIPTDVRIYYEGGMPYLDYTGTAQTEFGKVKVRLPKISLAYNVIENKYAYEERNVCDNLGVSVNKYIVKLSQEVMVKNDGYFVVEIIEREMTKEQIEKQLGYKVKIVKEND